MHAADRVADLLQMRREDGQTMAEYAVTLGVITILIVTAIGGLSAAIENAIGLVAELF